MDPEKVNYHYTDDLPTTPLPAGTRVLVTGANGYIGRRLVPELVARGYQVRCMLRNQGIPPLLEHPLIDVVYADGLDKPALMKAMEGIQAAYYLIHSLRMDKHDFQDADKKVARNFVEAANQCGVGKIIYLGGLGETSPNLSPHLRSRIEVGSILSEANCPVIRLRAAIILGAGSASYELVKSLVKNHRWVPFLPEFNSLCQPLAIRDVIKYLVGVLEKPGLKTGKYPMGGADVLTYKELVQKFANILGRRVRFFNVSWVPVPTPTLCRMFAYWMHFFSPVPVNIACLLLESLRTDVICPDNKIREILPFSPLDFETSVRWALEKEKHRRVFSRWSDVPPENMSDLMPIRQYEASEFIIEEHSRDIPAPQEVVFDIVCRIGGNYGWVHANILWQIRGWIDRLLGGVGLHRGRRDPKELRTGDSVDFWRVESMDPPRELLLRAELISPGFSWLQFHLDPREKSTRLTLKAHFIPYAFWGQLYWFVLSKAHTYIFKGMLEYFYQEAVRQAQFPDASQGRAWAET